MYVRDVYIHPNTTFSKLESLCSVVLFENSTSTTHCIHSIKKSVPDRDVRAKKYARRPTFKLQAVAHHLSIIVEIYMVYINQSALPIYTWTLATTHSPAYPQKEEFES